MKLINALMIVWVTVYGAIGNNNPFVLINDTEPKTFILDANDYNGSDLLIEIMDQEERVLLTYKMDTNEQEAIKINMKNLPDGIYTVLLEGELKTIENKVIIKNDNLIIDAEFFQINYKPVFSQTDDYLDLTWLQLDGNKVEILIGDREDNLVFDEIFLHDGNIQRRYDISRLEKGDYTFRLTSNGKSYTKVLSIR